MKQAFSLFFSEKLIKEPVMFLVARNNNLILNVRRARITAEYGEATIELEGKTADIEKAVKELEASGVKVDSVVGDVLQ